jgi:hypothetical protein
VLLAAVLWAAACDRGVGGSDTPRAESARADSSALAPDDCVRGEPQPALIATGATGPRPRFERTGKLEATEEGRLNDTTSLRITHGGCAHYVMTYAFTVRGAVRDTADSRYWLARSIDYLQALPVVETRRGEIDQIVTALQDAAGKPAPYTYGEAIRASELALVWATVRNAARGAVLVEIVFDVSL